MTLLELTSPSELSSFVKKHANTVVCFSATWCGPCKAAKPALEALAATMTKDPALNIHFGIVYEHNLEEDLQVYNVRAFPTYVLFQKGAEQSRMQGANIPGVEAMIRQAGCGASDPGPGQSLGGGGTTLTPEQAREARLARLGGGGASTATSLAAGAAEAVKETTPPEPMQVEEETKPAAVAEEVKEMDTDMKDATEEEEAPALAMMDPTADLDEALLKTLQEEMGFSMIRAQKGLLNGGGSVEGAVEWLLVHQEDEDIDAPIEMVPAGGVVAQSYKCNECGKILSNMANLELHANKTGHSDFEESTQAVKPLTEEEKAAKILEIKQLLAAKRAEREEQERVDEVAAEIQRRNMGKEMAKTREQLEQEQRKREAQLRKREKESFKKERERIRAELAKDKAERIKNKGKLSTKLGVDGYKPDAIQYDEGDAEMGEAGGPPSKKSKADVGRLDEYLTKLSSYKAGGDGGKCLKILKAYVGNVVDNPGEEKFRRINMENKVYKTKVKPFVGAKKLLLAVGFKQTEQGDAMQLEEDADMETLAMAKEKIEEAIVKYG